MIAKVVVSLMFHSVGVFMRFVVFFLFFGFLQSAMAINKCELNGKVSYQKAACPKQAKSKSLVKDKYISEQQLQEYKWEHIKKSEQAFEKVSHPKKTPVEIEQVHSQPNKQTAKHKPPHVNVPRPYDYVNPKLEEMDRKLEEHNKKLQQLQNAE